MNATTVSFWNDFRAIRADAQPEPYDVFKIGNDAASADEGVDLILSGKKTATSNLPENFEELGMPFEGALSVLLDGQDDPRAVTETTHVETKPFNAVDAAFAHDYGEWDQTLETWRKRIRIYYQRACEQMGLEWGDDRPLVCERFKVVFIGKKFEDDQIE